MEKIITYENLRNFAYSNDKLCKGKIRGIVLSFFGLGGMSMFDDEPNGTDLAGQDVVYLIPYNNPWAWMNRQAVSYTDELVDVIMNHYHLPEDIPIISTGGSMGGLSALTYMAYAKRTPAACVANCPVCDLPYHFTERPDLPRTLYSAFANYEGSMQDALESASPLHLAAKMPEAVYTIFHCECDMAVNKEAHSDRFVEALRGRMPVTYYVVPEKGHCDLTPEMWEKWREAMLVQMK